jgi:hypothetical protein
MGEVFIGSNGLIACAAASCSSTTGYSSATKIACPNGVISPSLINTHDHTEYATTAPDLSPTTRYECRSEWRTGADDASTIPYHSTKDVPTIAAQELRFVLGGATSVLGSGGVQGLLRNLAAYTSEISWLEGLTGAPVNFDTFPLGDTNGVILTSGCAYPSISVATGNNSVFSGGGIYAPHIAEGINLGAENEVTCTTQASNDLVTAQTSVIHGVGLNATDVNKIATAQSRLIWSPRSNISLYGNTASLTVYEEEGVPISLGTDWLPSGSMNMLRELTCADYVNTKYFNQKFTDQQLWQMVTSNAAVAAGFQTQIGTLAAGMVGDVTVFDGTTNTSYRAVIAASVEDVHLVLRGGTVLYGDAQLVAALSSSDASAPCAALDVCGISRSACIDVPSTTLAQIESAASSVYPLFFCRGQTPTNEPTCVPYRDTYPNGISSTDADGDGIVDGSDDCPTIFNPIREMDNGKQSDVDGDGYGDACDAKPLDATSH